MANRNGKVVVLGGGFTGLFAALYLRQKGYRESITLIDRETRFIFRPLLYDLLSREVQIDMVWPRYDELLLPKDVTFVTGEISAINLESKAIALDSGLTYDYEYLVMALGNTTGYFGVSGAEEHAFSFRTADDAFNLGKHLRHCLQQAEQNQESRHQLLTVAIVGAGPSGIELAATLGDLLPTWYENLNGNPANLRIVVIQRGDEILQSAATQDLRETAEKALENRQVSVELLLNAAVTSVTPDGVHYEQDGQSHYLPSQTVVWTAGNVVNPLIADLKVNPQHRDRQKRLKVKPTLQLMDDPNVFAGGDCAVIDDSPQPATAQVAYQQGQTIADNIVALRQGQPLQSSDVNLRGTLLKLGMDTGVASIFNKYEIKGHPAHLIRQAVYLNLLPTPARNIKQNAQWLADEVFEQVLNA